MKRGELDGAAAVGRSQRTEACLEVRRRCWVVRESGELGAPTAAAGPIGSSAPAGGSPAPRIPAAVGVATGGCGGAAARMAAPWLLERGCDRH